MLVENAFEPDQPTIVKKRFTKLSRIQLTAALDLGESIEEQEIILVSRPGSWLQYLVEQQIETSVTISDEGPHLDLRNWKHHYSPWRKLESTGDHRFRINAVSEAEASRFPKVSGHEIRAAVRRFRDTRWVQLVRSIKGRARRTCQCGLKQNSASDLCERERPMEANTVLDFLIPVGC